MIVQDGRSKSTKREELLQTSIIGSVRNGRGMNQIVESPAPSQLARARQRTCLEKLREERKTEHTRIEDLCTVRPTRVKPVGMDDLWPVTG